MKSTFLHSPEPVKVRLAFEYTLETAAERVRALYKILGFAERVAIMAVVILTVCLGVITFMQVSNAGMIVATYGDVCRALPTLVPPL